VGQEKGVPMITNKNQACFTKKSGCGLQGRNLDFSQPAPTTTPI
jgi:hypothetical protein